MALTHSPNIVRDGLIFAYDMGNRKSYAGPPIQNLLTTINVNVGTAAGYSITQSDELINVPEVGRITVKNAFIQNNFNVSAICCPSPCTYASQITVLPSTLYTFGILYKTETGYTHPNYMYRYEYTSADAYVTEGGVHSTGNRVSLGDGWFYAWGTFTTSATTAKLTAYSLYYQYSTQTDKFSVARVLLTPGNYAGLHPRYWPDLNSTRAATATLNDLTLRTQLTTNALSYASDGYPSFSMTNVSSTITVPLATAFNKLEGTINMWVYPTAYSTSNGLFVNRDSGAANSNNWFWVGSWNSANVFYFRLGNSAGCCNNDLTVGSWSSVCPLNTWTNVCVSWKSAGFSRIYVNGSLSAERSITEIPNANDTATGRIGLGHNSTNSTWNGRIDNTFIYNRQLTTAEIFQNYQALRRRYGIGN